jgi:hypothetical protein
LKSARVRMNIISAYRQVGSYRGAAELCGTTHKTSACGGKGRSRRLNTARVRRPRNFDVVAELAAARVDKSGGRISAKRLLPIARPGRVRSQRGRRRR